MLFGTSYGIFYYISELLSIGFVKLGTTIRNVHKTPYVHIAYYYRLIM